MRHLKNIGLAFVLTIITLVFMVAIFGIFIGTLNLVSTYFSPLIGVLAVFFLLIFMSASFFVYDNQAIESKKRKRRK